MATLCPSCLWNSAISQEDSPEASSAACGSTLPIVIPDDAPFPQGVPARLGNYEIMEKIAHGGMGVVYQARHAALDRVVALETIRSGVLAHRRDGERFQREARSAARLRHPNIVAIHDIGEQDGHHYFTMDFVPSENLAERTRTYPFSPRQPAAGLRICRGRTASVVGPAGSSQDVRVRNRWWVPYVIRRRGRHLLLPIKHSVPHPLGAGSQSALA